MKVNETEFVLDIPITLFDSSANESSVYHSDNSKTRQMPTFSIVLQAIPVPSFFILVQTRSMYTILILVQAKPVPNFFL